jgi:hypothetical protein
MLPREAIYELSLQQAKLSIQHPELTKRMCNPTTLWRGISLINLPAQASHD